VTSPGEPLNLPVCPDCDSPLVWLVPETPVCMDHAHIWWCLTCEQAVRVGAKL
jgi:hypothetical protein